MSLKTKGGKVMSTDVSTKKVSTKKGCLVASLMFIGLVALVAVIMSTCMGTESNAIELSASVKFDGSQFTISNYNDSDWEDVEFEVNDTYTYRVNRLPPGTYTIGCMQFTKSDGTRFNPLTNKVIKFDIFCEIDGVYRGWHGKFD